MKRARAVEEQFHVVRHSIDREVGADAQPAPPVGADVADEADRQRIDVRVHVRMIEASGMQAEAQDLFRRDFQPAVYGGSIRGAQIPFEEIAVGVVVESVVLTMMAPSQRRGEREGSHLPVEFDGCGYPSRLVRLEPLGIVQVSAGELRLPRSTLPTDAR